MEVAEEVEQPNSVLMTSAHSKIVEELKKVMPTAVDQEIRFDQSFFFKIRFFYSFRFCMSSSFLWLGLGLNIL